MQDLRDAKDRPVVLPLPSGTKDSLIDTLSTAIYSARVLGGHRIDPASLRLDDVQACIARGSPLDKMLTSFLGEQHVTVFIRSEIESSLLAEQSKWRRPTSFSELFTPTQAQELSRHLIKLLGTLPWDYSFTIQMPGLGPNALSRVDGRIDLSSCTQLITGAALRGHTEHRVAAADLMHDTPAELFDRRVYAQIKVAGYVSRDLQSDSFLRATEQLYSLVGLFLAFNVVDAKNAWLYGTSGVTRISTVRSGGDQVLLHFTSDLDVHYQGFFNELGYSEEFLGKIDSDDRLSIILERIRSALSNGAASRLQSAARWFLDSHTGNNAQVKFVQVVIAFEILLGDEKMSKDTGIGTLMANRCAYMIGNDARDRETIINDMQMGYRIRSRIVHAGASILTHDEKLTFSRMQELCALVITHEVYAMTSASQ